MKKILTAVLLATSSTLVFSAGPAVAERDAPPPHLVQFNASLRSILEGKACRAKPESLGPDADVDAQLVTLNRKGIERGLDFKTFRPANRLDREGYNELPVFIEVTGSGEDLLGFLADVCKERHMKPGQPRFEVNEVNGTSVDSARMGTFVRLYWEKTR